MVANRIKKFGKCYIRLSIIIIIMVEYEDFPNY